MRRNRSRFITILVSACVLAGIAFGGVRAGWCAAQEDPAPLGACAIKTSGGSAAIVTAARPGSVAAVGERRLAVFLYTFQDSIPDSLSPSVLTKEQIQDVMFGQGGSYGVGLHLPPRRSLSDVYRELSYGKIPAIHGDVFDWEQLERNASVNGICAYPTSEEIQASVARRGIAGIGSCDAFIIVADHPCLRGRAYPSVVNLREGDTRVTMPAVFVPHVAFYVLDHEFAHLLLGSWSEAYRPSYHADTLDCDPGKIVSDPSCVVLENGNPFDILGSYFMNYSPGHFNAFAKHRLGWLDEDSLLPIRLRSETTRGYTIGRLEGELPPPSQSPYGKLAAAIYLPGADDPAYYVEYRRPIGLDHGLENPRRDVLPNEEHLAKDNIKGLLIYRRYQHPDGHVTYPLLDMSPEEPPANQVKQDGTPDEETNRRLSVDLDRMALIDGSFHDMELGVTIGPVVQTGSFWATFQVGMPPPPTFTADPSTIRRYQDSVLGWRVPGARSCILVALAPAGKSTRAVVAKYSGSSGQRRVAPQATTEYELTCAGSGGSISQRVTVAVKELTPIELLGVTPVAPVVGQRVDFLVQVSNQGTIRSLAGRLRLLVDGREVVRKIITMLKSSHPRLYSLPWTARPGRHTARVCVDVSPRLSEPMEEKACTPWIPLSAAAPGS